MASVGKRGPPRGRLTQSLPTGHGSGQPHHHHRQGQNNHNGHPPQVISIENVDFIDQEKKLKLRKKRQEHLHNSQSSFDDQFPASDHLQGNDSGLQEFLGNYDDGNIQYLQQQQQQQHEQQLQYYYNQQPDQQLRQQHSYSDAQPVSPSWGTGAVQPPGYSTSFSSQQLQQSHAYPLLTYSSSGSQQNLFDQQGNPDNIHYDTQDEFTALLHQEQLHPLRDNSTHSAAAAAAARSSPVMGVSGGHYGTMSPVQAAPRRGSTRPPRKQSAPSPPPPRLAKHHRTSSKELPKHRSRGSMSDLDAIVEQVVEDGPPLPPVGQRQLLSIAGDQLHSLESPVSSRNSYLLLQTPSSQLQHPLLANSSNKSNAKPIPLDSSSPNLAAMSRHRSNRSFTLDGSPMASGHRRAQSFGGTQQPPSHRVSLSNISYGSGLPRPSHRRNSSYASSIGDRSMMSEASFMSVVSDIRKSSFYGGVDEETGITQMNYPNEHVHLSTDPSLVKGMIYKLEIDEDLFEEYHRAAEEAMWMEDDDLYVAHHTCGCHCPACNNACQGHTEPRKLRRARDPFARLPRNTFCLAVDDSVYRRVLDEISQASTMPCGLFHCGHHEDVDTPSIRMAVAILFTLFLVMGTAAYLMQG